MAIFLGGPLVFLVIIFGASRHGTAGVSALRFHGAKAAYYRVSKPNRLLVAAVYIGLIVVLAVGMHTPPTWPARSASQRSSAPPSSGEPRRLNPQQSVPIPAESNHPRRRALLALRLTAVRLRR